MVFLKDVPHHQLMKVENKFKKNKQKKEKKPKHESFATFGEWVSSGEGSSASSSDESNKKFTTRMGSSSNTCFMAKVMDSDVSDDDSDSPSIDELLDLVHEHQKVIKKQSKEIKTLVLSKMQMLLLLQILKIWWANSICLARSMKSSNYNLRALMILMTLWKWSKLSFMQFLSLG